MHGFDVQLVQEHSTAHRGPNRDVTRVQKTYREKKSKYARHQLGSRTICCKEPLFLYNLTA